MVVAGPQAFPGFMGVTLAIAISSNHVQTYPDLGAAYGTAKSGVGITGMGQRRPNLIMKSLIPIVMAGILGIYGMIVSVLLVKNSRTLSLILSRYQQLQLVPRLCKLGCRMLLRVQFFGCRLCCGHSG